MDTYERMTGLGMELRERNNERLFQGLGQLGQGLGAALEKERPLSDMEQDIAAIQAGAHPLTVAIKRRAAAGGVPSLVTGNDERDHDTFLRLQEPGISPPRTVRDATAASAYGKQQAPVQAAQARGAATVQAAGISAGGRVQAAGISAGEATNRARIKDEGDDRRLGATHEHQTALQNSQNATRVQVGQGYNNATVEAARIGAQSRNYSTDSIRGSQSDPVLVQLGSTARNALAKFQQYATQNDLFESSVPGITEQKQRLWQEYTQAKQAYDMYMQQRGPQLQGGFSQQSSQMQSAPAYPPQNFTPGGADPLPPGQRPPFPGTQNGIPPPVPNAAMPMPPQPITDPAEAEAMRLLFGQGQGY